MKIKIMKLILVENALMEFVIIELENVFVIMDGLEKIVMN